MDLLSNLSPVQILLTFVVIIVVYMVVIKGLTPELIMGFMAIWATVLYIGFGNLGAWECPEFAHKSQKRRTLDKKLAEFKTELAESDEDEDDEKIGDIYTAAAEAMKNVKEGLKDQKNIKSISVRPMPLVYSEDNYKENTFPELSGLGDNRLVTLQKHRGNKNREAMDRMARTNKYTNIGYLKRELDNTANSRWWDDESLEGEF
jgi:hypothetical protein